MTKGNKKIWKTASRCALIIAVILVLMVVLSSCTGGTATTNDLTQWAGENYKEDLGDLDNNTDVKWEAKGGFMAGIGWVLDAITRIMPWQSYVLALLVFAIIVELAMIPLSIKQQKTSIKQARLRPKEMAIRKKYAGRNDQKTQQILSQELQELYQKENSSPLAGCLPLLIQLPIIMVLYNVVVDPIAYILNNGGEFTTFMTAYFAEKGIVIKSSGSIELLSRMAEKWNNDPAFFNDLGNYCNNPGPVKELIGDLVSRAPNFQIGPFNMGYIPSFTPSEPLYWWFLAIPVLTFVVYFLTSKLQRKFSFQPSQSADDRQQACSNNMMDIMMPLMSVYFTFIMPAVIAIYWMFKSILGFVKQVIMSKAMPLPVFTDEDYKAAEKELAGKTPKKVQKSEKAGTVRSLHYIDDEDYDEVGNYIGEEEVLDEKDLENVEESEESAPAEELPENAMTDGATLKDESDREDRRAKKKKKKDSDTE